MAIGNPSMGMQQQQRQIMTIVPQMRQSLEVLQMPVMALQQLITHEMAQNPAIEDCTSPIETPLTSVERAEQPPEETQLPGNAPGPDDGAPMDFDPNVDSLIRQDDEWRDYFMQGMENAPQNDEADEKRQHLFDSIRQPESLSDHLLEQLTLTRLSKADREIAVMLIGNIDENGRFTGSLPDIAMVSDTTEAKVLSLLKIIQQFDPPGIAARDLRECLLNQLLAVPHPTLLQRNAKIIVDKYLDKLGAHDERFLCNNLFLTPEKLQAVTAIIRSLDPLPGRKFSEDHSEYVKPEIVVTRRKDGRYVVKVDDALLPHIHISEHYKNMLEDPNVTQETKSYIRERIRAGAFLIKSIDNRQETIRKIAQDIIDHQTDFFTLGVSALKPMTMTDVSKRVGLHETTVSRTVSGKYIQTPRGVFELRYFFTTGLKTDEGADVSNKSIRDLLQKVISGEPPEDPYSDQLLVKKLNDEHGIKIARRTVAKYRDMLKIPSAHERRRILA